MTRAGELMGKLIVAIAVLSGMLGGCQSVAPNANTAAITVAQPQAMQAFSRDSVRLQSSPFAHAQQVNIDYLLAMETDKLLAPYLREAGLPTAQQPYGNWESSGLDGHIGGHYLSALSLAYAASGDERLLSRLDYMLAQLRQAQLQQNGYLGGIPDGKVMWQQVANGDIRADLFSLNERWVPLYNIDKIFHGLRDAYQIAHRPQAKKMLLDLGQWMLSLTDALTDAQIQRMLYSEHGGLNEVFADIALISGDPRYVKLAQRFTHRQLITPLSKQHDELDGLHANTQIPKVIGALKVAQLTDNDAWQRAAEFFWQRVTQQRSVSIGGNSVREHFHSSDDFTPMITDVEGPETCNTYNMLKLSKMLFLQSGDTRYLDYYERATYNHILSSQHPQHGGLVYFTSMRPGHYRKYSSVTESMWCCVGSGIENHSKYGELVFTHKPGALAVNLFIASELHWQEQHAKVRLNTHFPDQQAVSLHLDTLKEPRRFAIKVRQPDWLKQPLTLMLNGQPIETAPAEQGYVTIDRRWQQGDSLSWQLDAQLYTEQLADGQNYYAVLYGPVVLATPVRAFANEQLEFIADDSRMGHIAAGPTCPPEALPMMLDSADDFIASLERLPSKELTWVAQDNVAMMKQSLVPERTLLVPFFRLHDSRYQVYWPQLAGDDLQQYLAQAKATAQKREALARITLDSVNPGEQQPEIEHDFQGQDTRAGVNKGEHWRDAQGWFSYRLKNPQQRATHLRIRYFKGDVNRQFSVHVNERLLAQVTLEDEQSPDNDFYTIDYPLSEAMRQAPYLRVRFSAGENSIAGGIYGVRLLAK